VNFKDFVDLGRSEGGCGSPRHVVEVEKLDVLGNLGGGEEWPAVVLPKSAKPRRRLLHQRAVGVRVASREGAVGVAHDRLAAADGRAQFLDVVPPVGGQVSGVPAVQPLDYGLGRALALVVHHGLPLVEDGHGVCGLVVDLGGHIDAEHA
jgi:hypothetical protein